MHVNYTSHLCQSTITIHLNITSYIVSANCSTVFQLMIRVVCRATCVVSTTTRQAHCWHYLFVVTVIIRYTPKMQHVSVCAAMLAQAVQRWVGDAT